LANLLNSFTFALSSVLTTKPWLYFLPHLKRVATLPRETRMFKPCQFPLSLMDVSKLGWTDLIQV